MNVIFWKHIKSSSHIFIYLHIFTFFGNKEVQVVVLSGTAGSPCILPAFKA